MVLELYQEATVPLLHIYELMPQPGSKMQQAADLDEV